MLKIRGWCAGVGVAVVLSVVSCTSGTGSAEKEPTVGPVSTVRTTSELVLPLDGYRLTLRNYIRVQRAAWLLTRDCVRRFGGDYTLQESAVLSNLPPLENDNDRRYGIFDAGLAASRGYRVPETGGTEGERRWNPSDAELLLVRGGTDPQAPTDSAGKPLPSGGCSGEATRTLEEGAPAPPNEKLANELSIESHKRSEADSRVRAGMSRWSECMAGRGYSYKSIWEPNDQAWPTTVGQVEIATATADIECKHETNFVGTWFTVESAYQKRLLEKNAEALAVVKSYVDAQARNAARVVGG